MMADAMRVHFVCEGAEEICFVDSLTKVGAFSGAYEISREDAHGAGNIPIVFDQAFQNFYYDAVFVILDVDCMSNGTYQDTVAKLERTLGFSARQIILFTNPCTIQLFLASRSDDVLPNQSKNSFTKYFNTLWNGGHKPYAAHAYQLEKLKAEFSLSDYEAMVERIKAYSTKPEDLPSTSAHFFLSKFKQSNTKWLEDVMDSKKMLF
jgi:hypothetical protein